MNTSNERWRRVLLRFALSVCLMGSTGWISLRAAQAGASPPVAAPSTQTSTDIEEQAALDEAFRSAEGNPQIIIRNLDAFLKRFPHSSRRELVLRTICTYALDANAPDVVAHYGQMLLEITPNDPQVLTLVIDAMARLNDPAGRGDAIEYSSRLIKTAENQRDQVAAAGASHNSPKQWAERIAALYAQRAGFYRDSAELDKAIADDEKSYAIYPTSRVAEQLGDSVLQKGDSTRALDYYLTAFAFPDRTSDPERRREVRRKLGSLYLQQHGSEKGLGSLVLSRYDALNAQLADRLYADNPQNAGLHDPLILFSRILMAHRCPWQATAARSWSLISGPPGADPAACKANSSRKWLRTFVEILTPPSSRSIPMPTEVASQPSSAGRDGHFPWPTLKDWINFSM